LELPIELNAPQPWEREAAFAVAASGSDLLVDSHARLWCAAASQDIAVRRSEPIFGPKPWLKAFKAFARLAPVSTEEEASRFLELSRTLVPREPDTYRHTDDDHVQALIVIARTHPNLRSEALAHLLQAVLASDQMAERVLGSGADVLAADPVAVTEACGASARDGDLHAALAIVVAGGNPEDVMAQAAQRVDAAVAPREHQPGVFSFGGTGRSQVSVLATVLPDAERERFAQGMLTHVKDEQETAPDRYEAHGAIQAIAPALQDEARDRLFAEIAVLAGAEARGEMETGHFDFGNKDPLSRIRISLGEADLVSAALVTLSMLAHTPEQFELVQREAVRRLADAGEEAANAVAVALIHVPPEQLTLPVDLLAAHPSRWVRTLAAVLWARKPDEASGIGVRLARDDSALVRRSLAGELGDDPRHVEVRAILAGDPRRSVRLRALALEAAEN
jgi:hypothetical protein